MRVRVHALIAALLLALPTAGHAGRGDTAAPGEALPQPALAETLGDAVLRVPTGPWNGAAVPMREVRGPVRSEVYRIALGERSTDWLANRVATLLEQQGYGLAFRCRDSACGGFDFRFALDVRRAPEMHVDLGDYVFLALHRPEDDAWACVIVSRGAETGFVEIRRTGAPEPAAVLSTRTPEIATTPVPSTRPGPGREATLAERLEESGAATLADVRFATGSTEIPDPAPASLAELAAWLQHHPGTRIVLVGHTDSAGSLTANMTISRKRAEAVRQQLLALGVAPERVEARGVGPLAPIASNATAEGRERNRRVVAVLLSQ